MLNVPLILASTSPRRIELLKQVGLRVEVVPPDADETPKRGEDPRAMVKRLARAKAESVLQAALWKHGAAVIIGSDTTVVAPDGRKILGKPRDEREARSMLKSLAGKTHTVHTGYCVLAAGREIETEKILRVVSTRVTMRKLSAAEVERYVASGEPMDKAGGYAAQGMGMALVESVKGSYANVIGLPVAQLLRDLEAKFGVPLFGE